MFGRLAARLLQAVAFLPVLATAQSVFAHVVVGNNGAYTVEKWTEEIVLASSFGIDAFVLNIGTPFEGTTATQLVSRLLYRRDNRADFPSELCVHGGQQSAQ